MSQRAACLAAAAAALTLAPAALAHVTVSPATVEEDTTASVVLVTPNEREGHETVRLTVDLPGQVEAVAATAPAGWVVRRTRTRVTWSGGRIRGTDTVEFPLRLHAVGPAGRTQVASSQAYEDGSVVRWQAELTVLPATGSVAPRSHVRRAVLAGVVGIGLIGASLLVLHLLRRPPRST
jgi:uncharacterized protein YcnI